MGVCHRYSVGCRRVEDRGCIARRRPRHVQSLSHAAASTVHEAPTAPASGVSCLGDPAGKPDRGFGVQVPEFGHVVEKPRGGDGSHSGDRGENLPSSCQTVVALQALTVNRRGTLTPTNL